MQIGEVVAATGLSEDTIRFYERQGLIPRIRRDGGGRRRFTPEEVGRLAFLNKLRATGMPLRDMQAYVALVAAGDHTVADRRGLLESHAAKLRADLEMRQAALAALEGKIALYRGAEEGAAAPACCGGAAATITGAMPRSGRAPSRGP